MPSVPCGGCPKTPLLPRSQVTDSAHSEFSILDTHKELFLGSFPVIRGADCFLSSARLRAGFDRSRHRVRDGKQKMSCDLQKCHRLEFSPRSLRRCLGPTARNTCRRDMEPSSHVYFYLPCRPQRWMFNLSRSGWSFRFTSRFSSKGVPWRESESGVCPGIPSSRPFLRQSWRIT